MVIGKPDTGCVFPSCCVSLPNEEVGGVAHLRVDIHVGGKLVKYVPIIPCVLRKMSHLLPYYLINATM